MWTPADRAMNRLKQRMQKIVRSDPKLLRLKTILKELQPGVVAVSGGVDSRFLATLVVLWDLDVRAVFFDGPQMTGGEKEQAVRFLTQLGIGFDLLQVDPRLEEEVRNNGRQRCYCCKRTVFSQALRYAGELGRFQIMEGSHLTDRTGYRPGRVALAELGIRSPLAEAGLSKGEIRELGAKIGLEYPGQPSRPCLLTRFAYGYKAMEEEIERVGRAEDALCSLGFTNFRIRIPDRDRVLLQLVPKERSLAETLASRIEEVLAENRLSPFEVLITETISGFFDGEHRADSRHRG